MEIWKDIGIIYGIDFTGLYQISNLGRVKSLNYNKTGKEQVLTPGMNDKGYLQIGLCKDGKRKPIRINRLVAIAFDLSIPDHLKHIPIERLEVNHKDEDKTNNCVWNLEWCDSKYNNNYGTRNKRIADALKGVPKTEETKRKISETKKGVPNVKLSKPVLQLDKVTGEVIREWPSTREVQRQLGYTIQSIYACCNGKYKSSYGFKWSYA